MASLQKIQRKSGTAYKIRYRLDGKPFVQYLSIGTTKQESNAILAEFNHRLARHKSNIESFKNPCRHEQSTETVQDFEEWFFINKKTATGEGRTIAKKTLVAYRAAFKFLLNSIGNIHLSEIPKRIPDIEDSLKPYAPASRGIHIRHLRAAWNFGIRRDKIKENPFYKIDIPRKSQLPEIYTIEEKNRIFQKIKHPHAKLAFALGRYAGLRRKEIVRNLRWEDIWWDQDVINIPHGKTGERQKVPLFPKLKEILKEHQKKDGFIVDIHPDNITHHLSDAKKEAGIKKKGAVHILRHSLGADLRSQDMDIRDIQDVLRHAQITTTEIYTQLSTQKLKDKMKSKKL